MPHLSLYRKFRPETFGEIVRQEHVVRILTSQIEKNAVGHAYLFTGPRGTGKTSIARIFARAVNCEKPVNGSPCGACPTCRALSEGSLDITEIDAASNNGVNEMRDLREKVQYPPVSGKYKVYIVDEVHMLTDSAFNALLKTLEEPPAHAIFILATTEPQKIPATILSRCMRLDFKLIPVEDLEKHLKSVLERIGKEYEEEAVAAIARAGAGSDRDMLSIAEACIVYSEKLTYGAACAVLGAADFHETAKLVRAMLSLDMPTAFSVCEGILAEGKSVGVLLKDILDLLSQVTVAKTCKNAEKLLSLPKELYASVKEIADGADGRTVLRATEIFIKTENELRFVSSPRISLEAALMRVAYPEADADVEALLVRVNALEAKLGSLPQSLPASRAQAERPAEPQPAPSDDGYEFPMEEPVFEEAYFSDGPAAGAKNEAPKQPAAEEVRQKRDTMSEPPVQKTQTAAPSPADEPAPKPVQTKSAGDAEGAYARFMRALRTTAKNGVLFTVCSDLLVHYEAEKLVFETESKTILGILEKDANKRTMAEVLGSVGVTDYEVRCRGEVKKSPRDALEELKQNFKDYPIDIK